MKHDFITNNDISNIIMYELIQFHVNLKKKDKYRIKLSNSLNKSH